MRKLCFIIGWEQDELCGTNSTRARCDRAQTGWCFWGVGTSCRTEIEKTMQRHHAPLQQQTGVGALHTLHIPMKAKKGKRGRGDGGATGGSYRGSGDKRGSRKSGGQPGNGYGGAIPIAIVVDWGIFCLLPSLYLWQEWWDRPPSKRGLVVSQQVQRWWRPLRA